MFILSSKQIKSNQQLLEFVARGPNEYTVSHEGLSVTTRERGLGCKFVMTWLLAMVVNLRLRIIQKDSL